MAENLFAMLQKAQETASTADSKMFGVEVGIVTNVKDDQKLGRVKVCFPRLPGKPESDWVRVVQPAAGAGRGFYWLPEVNDEPDQRIISRMTFRLIHIADILAVTPETGEPGKTTRTRSKRVAKSKPTTAKLGA